MACMIYLRAGLIWSPNWQGEAGLGTEGVGCYASYFLKNIPESEKLV